MGNFNFNRHNHLKHHANLTWAACVLSGNLQSTGNFQTPSLQITVAKYESSVVTNSSSVNVPGIFSGAVFLG